MKTYLLLSLSVLSFLFVRAQSQNALDFDGLDDEVTVPGASSLIAGSNQISISCWVYPTNANPMYPDFDGFCGFRNEIDCDFYMMQISPANTIEARFRNSLGTDFTIAYQGLILNTWQHLALTFDGSMLRLYQGGLLADSVAASGGITNTAESFHIGSLPYGINPYWLTGKVDEISLFNRALTPYEVGCISQETVNPSDPGCMLFYNCNQGIANGVNTSISALEDLSGHIDGVFNAMALTGATSNFVGGVTNAASTAYTLCEGNYYVLGNDTLTQEGFYYNITSQNGACGNLQELHLFVIPVDSSVTLAGETLTANAAGASYQWVDCNNGYAFINGATSQSFTPSSDGNYALIIAQNGCADTSSCYTITNVGIHENISDVDVRISPNPVSNVAMIEIKNSGSTLIIQDVEGRIVYRQYHDAEKFSLDVSDWQNGIYLLTVQNVNSTFHSKIIKE
jgi:hypothetical protein